MKQDVSQREDSPDDASGGWITSGVGVGVAKGVAAVMGVVVVVSVGMGMGLAVDVAVGMRVRVAVGVAVGVAVAVGPYKRRALELVHRFRESCPGQSPGLCRA